MQRPREREPFCCSMGRASHRSAPVPVPTIRQKTRPRHNPLFSTAWQVCPGCDFRVIG